MLKVLVVVTGLFFASQVFAQGKCDVPKIKAYAADVCKGWEAEKAKFANFEKMPK